ncbi:hypothetical protein ACKFKG_32180 [Phormidesmis sp. 146-35]
MNDTNSNGYGTDDAYGCSGYDSPGYQSSDYEALGYKSPGYGDGTGYGATEAIDHQQTGYAPPDTWTSGYQENVYDRANLLDTPYLDTAANPNPIAVATFAPYGSSNQGYEPPQPLPKPKQQIKNHLSFDDSPYRSSTFELEL